MSYDTAALLRACEGSILHYQASLNITYGFLIDTVRYKVGRQPPYCSSDLFFLSKNVDGQPTSAGRARAKHQRHIGVELESLAFEVAACVASSTAACRVWQSDERSSFYFLQL